MYGLAGERRLTETELDWLPGYEGSKPVRIGNAAYRQLQLDVYGEVMDTLHLARTDGSPSQRRRLENLSERSFAFWKATGTSLTKGIWEVRGPKRHFTHSKVMAWVASTARSRPSSSSGERGRWTSGAIFANGSAMTSGARASIRSCNSFVRYYGSKELDASLLMLPLVGFLAADRPALCRGRSRLIQRETAARRFRATLLRSRLRTWTGCRAARAPSCHALSGWPTTWLCRDAMTKRARIFERLLDCRNDLGLLAEEYSPEQKRLLGNFPQAFSHIGLINTARNLAEKGGPAELRPEPSRG